MAIASLPQHVLLKEEQLKNQLFSFHTMVVAYSGGVDSAYLADVAHEAVGMDAHILLADSPSIPRAEVQDAEALAAARGWHFVRVQTQEFEKDEFLRNDGSRCYHCKTELFTHMAQYATQHELRVLAYGEISEDALDPTRMGARAAREHRIAAPLADARLTKEEIRQLSLHRGLPTWNKASFACLSSRFPRGTRVNVQEMQRVEQAEEILKREGFHQYRARHHGDLCRIEVDTADISRFFDPAFREALVQELRRIGYRHVTLDLEGYRTGSTA